MSEKSWEKLHIDKDQEPFGVGEEKKVYQDKENPDRVIGKYRREKNNPFQVKGSYYLTKILHVLFPKNIPDIHLAAMKPTVSVRKKVELGTAHHFIREQWLKEEMIGKENEHHINRAMSEITNDPKISALKDKLHSAGVDVDNFPGNFGIDDEGNAQYIEDFYPFHPSPNDVFAFDYSALLKAIMDLPEKERSKALKYLERLNDLAEEEKKSLKERGY